MSDDDCIPLRKPHAKSSRDPRISRPQPTQQPPPRLPPRKFNRNVPVVPLSSLTTNFWNFIHFVGSDVPELETDNPLDELQYCLNQLRKFIPTVPNLVLKLNRVANHLYRLGANRPCANPWCEYGRAAKPMVLPTEYAKIKEKKTRNGSTMTDNNAGEPGLVTSVCLPTEGAWRKSLSPTQSTL